MSVGGGCVVCLWKDQDLCSLWRGEVDSTSEMSSTVPVSSAVLVFGIETSKPSSSCTSFVINRAWRGLLVLWLG